jgi:hypothetical protein
VGAELVGRDHVTPVHDEWRQVVHAAQLEGASQRRERVVNGGASGAVLSVRGFPATCADYAEQALASEGVATSAVGPSVLKDEALPLLDQRRSGLPEHRMLQHDRRVGVQESLLTSDVDVEFRVRLIEVVERDLSELLHGVDESGVDAGFLQRGVGKQ